MAHHPSSASTIIPSLRYRDAHKAIEWLCRAFGFEKHVIHADGDTVHHAELVFGNGMIMIGSAHATDSWSRQIVQPSEINGCETQSPCVIVDDPDGHCARAEAAGAKIILPVSDQEFGGRAYACRDPEGHLWWFGDYNPWKTRG